MILHLGTTMIYQSNPPDEDRVGFGKNVSNVLGLLEPQILETAYRLGVKLVHFKVAVFSDSAKFAEQLGLEPGDEIIIAYPQQEYTTFRSLTETLKMKGVTVHSFISMKIPTDYFAFGVKKKRR